MGTHDGAPLCRSSFAASRLLWCKCFSVKMNRQGQDTKKKRGAVCYSFHVVKAFALPCLSKRATPKAPRWCYINPFSATATGNTMSNGFVAIVHQRGESMLYIIIPWGVPCCFVLDKQFEVAKFLRRQNQSVQLRLLCICLPTTITPQGFRHWCATAKIQTYFEISTLLVHENDATTETILCLQQFE